MLISRGGGGGGKCASAKWKIGKGFGTSLSRFELENGGLRNELDPFLAWKWDSPELPGRVWLTRGAANGTLRNCHNASG